MAIDVVAIREEIHWLHVGLSMQGGAFKVGRYQVQSETSGQEKLSKERHRLLQDFLSRRQAYFH